MSVHNEYTGYLLKHLLLRHMYNLPLPVLLCYAQALRSETSYCYYRVHCPSACPSVSVFQLRLGLSAVCSASALALYCAVLYILLV